MHNNKRRVLFIVKQRYCYGEQTNAYGLYNSCDFISRYLNEIGVESKVVSVIDNNSIDREVSLYKPTDVFIEALWVVPEKFKILSNLHPNVKWHIRLHSKTSFIATENIAFEWINSYMKLRRNGIDINLSANSEDFFDDLRTLFDEACVNFSPNIYYPSKPNNLCRYNEFKKYDDEIHIGLFGALRPLKNHLKQAMWAIEYSNKNEVPIAVHINASEHEILNSNTSSVLKNIKNLFLNTNNNCRLIQHPWYPHAKFLNLVSKMDMGLQVSFSETFNITAADFVYMGVPIVVSEEVKFVNPFSRVESSISNEEIVNVMNLSTSFVSCGLNTMNKYLLNRSNVNSEKAWKKLLIA